MHGSTVIRVSAVLLGFCALGLYLVLSRTDQTVARRIRRIGAVTAAIAFCLFLFMAGTRPDGWPQTTLGWWTDSNSHWWPESQLQDIPTAIAFWVFAAGGVAAASFAVCTSRSHQAAIGLGLLSLFNAGLFVFHGAVLAAVATVVVTGGAAAALWWMETLREIEESTETATDNVAGTPTTCDPAMACIVGFLISLMLVGTVSFALTEEVAGRDTPVGRSALTTVFERPADRQRSLTSRRKPASTSLKEKAVFANRWILYAAATALSVAAATGVVVIRRQAEFAANDEESR